MRGSVMKTAVVLLNLGGPDSPESVRPFLQNLFCDPAILRIPAFVRFFLARFIAWKRAPYARAIYAKIGGKSPLLELTKQQEKVLESQLASLGDFKVFTVMRYWHPFAKDIVNDVQRWGAERVVLLPLYPQFSTTTTASSFSDWEEAAFSFGLDVVTTKVCCYPWESYFVSAHENLLRTEILRAEAHGKPRVLFSAHGIPQMCVEQGDPYQWQVERCSQSVVEALSLDEGQWTVCYQSKVGRLQWLEPSLDEEIRRAAIDKVPVVVVPIAFVSEHSETLVELDMDFRELAEELGLSYYGRVPALGVEPMFIKALVRLVQSAVASSESVCSLDGARVCPKTF